MDINHNRRGDLHGRPGVGTFRGRFLESRERSKEKREQEGRRRLILARDKKITAVSEE